MFSLVVYDTILIKRVSLQIILGFPHFFVIYVSEEYSGQLVVNFIYSKNGRYDKT